MTVTRRLVSVTQLAAAKGRVNVYEEGEHLVAEHLDRRGVKVADTRLPVVEGEEFDDRRRRTLASLALLAWWPTFRAEVRHGGPKT